MQVLITGGAGFIGSHVARELLAHSHRVRVLDNLVAQVHGPDRPRPPYLEPEVELVGGDIRDEPALARALENVEAVIHLAALVGVGQSMYRISEYMSVNTMGTAGLLQMLSAQRVRCLVVASSMSVYGEGSYRNADGLLEPARDRDPERLKMGIWEVHDAQGRPMEPVPTREDKPPTLASVYALSKYDQERLCLLLGRAYGIRTVALRLFNVYGPYQALSNPYTGVLSNFASRVLNARPPLVYEDGLQKRDFVSVYDVARAFRLAVEDGAADGAVLNISSGEPLTVAEVAQRTIHAIGPPGMKPEITEKYRAGDIRHCFADISLARQVLGWSPGVSLETGLQNLAAWLEDQRPEDRALQAREELSVRGLLV